MWKDSFAFLTKLSSIFSIGIIIKSLLGLCPESRKCLPTGVSVSDRELLVVVPRCLLTLWVKLLLGPSQHSLTCDTSVHRHLSPSCTTECRVDSHVCTGNIRDVDSRPTNWTCVAGTWGVNTQWAVQLDLLPHGPNPESLGLRERGRGGPGTAALTNFSLRFFGLRYKTIGVSLRYVFASMSLSRKHIDYLQGRWAT